MITVLPAPCLLCNQCFIDRGLQAIMVNGMVSMLPTAMANELTAVTDFLSVATPCPHVAMSLPQKEASDEWLAASAALAVIPVGLAYDAIRVRYTALVASALDRANNLGGLV